MSDYESTPSPETIPGEQPTPESGVESAIISSTDFHEEAVALGGIRGAWRNWRLSRRLNNLSSLEASENALKEAAAAVQERRPPKTESRPATRLQRKQGLRAARRQRKANEKRLRNIELQMGYGAKISTDEGRREIREASLGRTEAKTIKKVTKEYRNNLESIVKIDKKISRSAIGKDIPGRIVDSRIRSNTKKANKIIESLGAEVVIIPPINALERDATQREFTVSGKRPSPYPVVDPSKIKPMNTSVPLPNEKKG